jgi:hypothetical protein
VSRAVAYPTPNPDSLKFTADGDDARPFIESGLAAFHSAREATGDPLGEALFGVEGVAGVLVLPAFVTVTKRPDAQWATVAGRVEAILNAHLERTT